MQWDAPSDVLSEWANKPQAAEADDPNTISIYDVIGHDMWTGDGITAKKIAGILRVIGTEDVTVNINSPGGDFFEGIAIYNLLREHPAKVTVKVQGYAASAASVIAMAGDEIIMGLGSFLMIHNAWGCACGNRHDMKEVAAILEPFDKSMATIYEARSNQKYDDIVAMMDGETWIPAQEAIDKGFAETLADDEKLETKAQIPVEIAAKRKLDALLASKGMPRSDRRNFMKEITSMQDATEPTKQDAGDDVMQDANAIMAALSRLKQNFN